MKATKFAWTCSSTCFVFFDLLTYLVTSSISLTYLLSTWLLDLLLCFFSSPYLDTTSSQSDALVQFTLVCLNPLSLCQVFFVEIAFFQRWGPLVLFPKGFFFNIPNGLFFTMSLRPKKGKQSWAINLLQYNHLITFGKGTIQIYEFSCEFNHRFLDLDAIVHYIFLFFEIKIYKYTFIIAKGLGDIPLWLQPCWYHTAR